MKTVFISHIRPILDFCSSVWNLDYVMDVRSLESVQSKWTKKTDGFSLLPYHERLRRLSLFSVWGRLLDADLILAWKITHDLIPSLSGILVPSTNTHTRGHQYKLAVRRTKTEARRRFFTNRVVTTWNNLPSEVVMSPSLQIFKSRLHEALGDLLFFYYE